MQKQINFPRGPPGITGSVFSLGRFLLISQNNTLNLKCSGLFMLKTNCSSYQYFLLNANWQNKGGSIGNPAKEPS